MDREGKSTGALVGGTQKKETIDCSGWNSFHDPGGKKKKRPDHNIVDY